MSVSRSDIVSSMGAVVGLFANAGGAPGRYMGEEALQSSPRPLLALSRSAGLNPLYIGWGARTTPLYTILLGFENYE